MAKRLRTRFWGPFKQEWFSICSNHSCYDAMCPRCQAGQWINVVVRMIDNFVYVRHYKIWFWWHNRPNSRTNRFLRRVFPNMR
jgi:hypothetical protein